MKTLRGILFVIVLLFVLVSVFWQYEYEQKIKEINATCINVSQRKRLKYTPVVLVKLNYLINKKELIRDRLLHNLLTADCEDLSLCVTGHQLMYLTHVYMSEREKDSLLLVYDKERNKRSVHR